MITSEECKQIAAKLRQLKVSDTSSPWDYLDKLDEIIDVDWGCEETCERLADLIEPEEFTCQMEPSFITPGILDSIQEYTCSDCGKQTFSQVLGGDEDVPKYCSYCGKKVVE